MSYTEQAEQINVKLKFALGNVPEQQKKDIINALLWFGQVAKFRCRSNSAFDNFSKEVLRDIAEPTRKDRGLGFETLKVD